MVHNILNLIHDNILKLRQGSTIPRITIDVINKLQVPIPRNATLITNLEKDFKKIETLQQEIKDSEIEYKQVLQELSDDIKLETITKYTQKKRIIPSAI